MINIEEMLKEKIINGSVYDSLGLSKEEIIEKCLKFEVKFRDKLLHEVTEEIGLDTDSFIEAIVEGVSEGKWKTKTGVVARAFQLKGFKEVPIDHFIIALEIFRKAHEGAEELMIAEKLKEHLFIGG